MEWMEWVDKISDLKTFQLERVDEVESHWNAQHSGKTVNDSLTRWVERWSGVVKVWTRLLKFQPGL